MGGWKKKKRLTMRQENGWFSSAATGKFKGLRDSKTFDQEWQG